MSLGSRACSGRRSTTGAATSGSPRGHQRHYTTPTQTTELGSHRHRFLPESAISKISGPAIRLDIRRGGPQREPRHGFRNVGAPLPRMRPAAPCWKTASDRAFRAASARASVPILESSRRCQRMRPTSKHFADFGWFVVPQRNVVPPVNPARPTLRTPGQTPRILAISHDGEPLAVPRLAAAMPRVAVHWQEAA